MTRDSQYTVGNDNIYADLGFEDPELELSKAELARQISALIASQRLTQVRAAEKLGIDQPKVSALRRGRLGGFSLERLMTLLTRLDQDIEISVRPKAETHSSGRIAVSN
jgi:predicted XRE-type DNA-binding protein